MELVKALVELGANVNARGRAGTLLGLTETPLLRASNKGHAETVKALVAARADVLVECLGGCVASFWRATIAMAS